MDDSLSSIIGSLKSQPDSESFLQLLRRYNEHQRSSPTTGQSSFVIQCLVEDMLLSQWPLITSLEHSKLFLQPLYCVAGFKAIVLKLRNLVTKCRNQTANASIALNIRYLLEITDKLLSPINIVHDTLRHEVDSSNSSTLHQSINDFARIIADGQLLSLCMEATDIASLTFKHACFFDKLKYSQWLAQRLSHFLTARTSPGFEIREPLYAGVISAIFRKALQLDGFNESFLDILINEHVHLHSEDISYLLKNIPLWMRKRLLMDIFRYLADHHLRSIYLELTPNAQISTVVTFLNNIIRDVDDRRKILNEYLTHMYDTNPVSTFGIRRAVIASIAACDIDLLSIVSRNLLSQLGDVLYIKHTPLTLQQAHTQNLLLSIGYLSRINASEAISIYRSSIFIEYVSHRLESSYEPARVLGLVAGEVVSGTVDKVAPLKFDLDGTESFDVKWYKKLASVIDTERVLGPTSMKLTESPSDHARQSSPSDVSVTANTKKHIEQRDTSIVAYPKPIHNIPDPDTPNEDDLTVPTEANVRPPLYIRDLLRYMRDSENYEKQKLAVTSARDVILRRANHGTEVEERAEEIASVLIGLQDNFSLADFWSFRLQACVALISVSIHKMAPYFIKTFTTGDLTVSQRVTILASLGIAAQQVTAKNVHPSHDFANFPSKRLPEQMERFYMSNTHTEERRTSHNSLEPLLHTAISSMAGSLTEEFIAPIIEGTGNRSEDNSMKVSSLPGKSAYISEAKVIRQSTVKSRKRVFANTTSMKIYTLFFSPLNREIYHALRSPSSRTSRNTVLNPMVFALCIKTLAIFVHSCGPTTLALPQLTSDVMSTISHYRSFVNGEVEPTLALLMLLASILHIHTETDGLRELCSNYGRECIELLEWSTEIANTNSTSPSQQDSTSDSSRDNYLFSLASGVSYSLQQGISKYQLLIVDHISSFI